MSLDPAAISGFDSSVPLAGELREAHISWVLMLEREVVKFKKPVRFPFLDLSRLSQRHSACKEELRLNCSLAADVYLGLSQLRPTAASSSALQLEAAEPPDPRLEWRVRMRRLRDEVRADDLLEGGKLTLPQLEAVAEQLSCFHSERVVDRDDSDAAAGAQLAVVEENVSEDCALQWPTALQPVVDDACDQILSFATSHRDRLERRGAQGHTVEGHGDLRLEHIYFENDGSPRVIDCVEFSRRLRVCDPASDGAFLHMDLALLGRPAGPNGGSEPTRQPATTGNSTTW